MNFSNIKHMKNIAKNLREIKSNVKKYIKRQDILNFIEKCFKQEYTSFKINQNTCTFYQNGANTFHIEIFRGLGKAKIWRKNSSEYEEYNLDFDKEKTTIEYKFSSGWKFTRVEKIYEYHNDILVKETINIIDNATNNCSTEKEAIYDTTMKMLMRKRRQFIINMNETYKEKEIHYEATSFVEGINIDSKKNPTENFSYLDLHIPCVEIREHSYKMATERLENNGAVKNKVKGLTHGGRSE